MKKILLATALIVSTTTVLASSKNIDVKSNNSVPVKQEKLQSVSATESTQILIETMKQALHKSENPSDFTDSLEMTALMTFIDNDINISKVSKSNATGGGIAYLFDGQDKETGKLQISLIIIVKEKDGQKIYQVLTQNH